MPDTRSNRGQRSRHLLKRQLSRDQRRYWTECDWEHSLISTWASPHWSSSQIYFERNSENQLGAHVGSSTAGVILEHVQFNDPAYDDESVSGYIIEGPSSDTDKCLAAQ